MINPLVAGSLKFFKGQPDTLVRFIELFCPLASCPLRFERRQDPRDLAEVRAITAKIGTCAFCEFNLGVRNYLFDDFGDFRNPVILGGLSDIE